MKEAIVWATVTFLALGALSTLVIAAKSDLQRDTHRRETKQAMYDNCLADDKPKYECWSLIYKK